MPDKIHKLLDFWFGDLGTADLPTSARTSLWFGHDDVVKHQLIENFKEDYEAAIAGYLPDWALTSRGRLALILLLDQFPRYFYRHTKDAFNHDQEALKLCVEGLRDKMDQSLTLIERVFFYMPLVHSEDPIAQEKSIRLYQDLVSLSMTETTQVYQLFLAYAYAHFKVIKEFGRFPQRNHILGRSSTEAEIAFLKNA